MRIDKLDRLDGKGFVFSLDAMMAVIIIIFILGAVYLMIPKSDQDNFRSRQLAFLANDGLVVLDEMDVLETHDKSLIRAKMVETLPNNIGAKLFVTVYECVDEDCEDFQVSEAIPPYEIIKGRDVPIDLMIVMDASSSMSDGPLEPSCSEWWCTIFYAGCSWCTGGIGDAKVAAKSFLDFLYFGKDRAGLVTFGDEAHLKEPLTTQKVDVRAEIDAVTVPCDCNDIQLTDIGEGIANATEELVSNGRANADWVQIMLSDGNYTGGLDPIQAAQNASAHGIKIYTIGLGNDANAALLQDIAAQTGGSYYYAPDSDGLEAIFSGIAKEILRVSDNIVTAKRSYVSFEEGTSKYFSIGYLGVWII